MEKIKMCKNSAKWEVAPEHKIRSQPIFDNKSTQMMKIESTRINSTKMN